MSDESIAMGASQVALHEGRESVAMRAKTLQWQKRRAKEYIVILTSGYSTVNGVGRVAMVDKTCVATGAGGYIDERALQQERVALRCKRDERVWQRERTSGVAMGDLESFVATGAKTLQWKEVDYNKV